MRRWKRSWQIDTAQYFRQSVGQDLRESKKFCHSLSDGRYTSGSLDQRILVTTEIACQADIVNSSDTWFHSTSSNDILEQISFRKGRYLVFKSSGDNNLNLVDSREGYYGRYLLKKAWVCVFPLYSNHLWLFLGVVEKKRKEKKRKEKKKDLPTIAM